jgi:hypothetical protein
MAGELANDHAAYLRGNVGRDPTSGELYAAHFLGPEGSARLIRAVQANPGAPAASLFPDAAHANRSIFYRAGRPATVAEVYANLTTTPAGAMPATGGQTREEQTFMAYASGRALDRIEQQRQLISVVLRGSEGDEGTVAGSIFDAALMRAIAYGQARRD